MKIKLRTLFIFVTLAIFLAVFFLAPFVRSRADKRVREALQEQFSSVEFKTHRGRTTELKCVGTAGLPQMVDTKTLSQLRDLESLSLENCRVTNADKNRSLYMNQLTLQRVQMDDGIRMPNLERLNITRSAIGVWFTPSDERPTPDGYDFKPFRNANSLRTITISKDFVTNFYGLESLNQISLIETKEAKIYSIRGIDQLESLKHLDIASDWQRTIPLADVVALCNCKSLETLWLSGDVEPGTVERIKKALPGCEIHLVQ